ncbi:MAG: PIN domain-containing protein [Gemmatimonadetes bacterium]|nr:PIN domain-containing protein [Gemmatimonadota bacterium]
MKRVFTDSNVFIRILTRDDSDQQRRAEQLLKDAEAGKVLLVTGPPVLFEVTWTLRRVYDIPRDGVLDAVRRILATKGLELTDRALVEDALRRALASQQEFADAYIAASLDPTACESVATFNREHFAKLGVQLHSF